MISFLIAILLLGILLALLKPYVEPALFNVAVVLVVVCVILWFLRAANLFSGVPMPRLFGYHAPKASVKPLFQATHEPVDLSSVIYHNYFLMGFAFAAAPLNYFVT